MARRSSAATGGGFSPPRRPPLSTVAEISPPPSRDEEEEAAALSISDQRTLYLVNIFIGNTSRFLNSFSALCEDKLSDVHRRILKLDATLNLLEAKLRNTYQRQDLDNSSIGTIGSSSQPLLQNLSYGSG